MVLLYVCFFFSSRRRHTRLVSDWSSDVCSSDLACLRRPELVEERRRAAVAARDLLSRLLEEAGAEPVRSEERRVGKECRSRGGPSDEKKKWTIAEVRWERREERTGRREDAGDTA